MDLSLKIKTICFDKLEDVPVCRCEEEAVFSVGDLVEWISGKLRKKGEVIQVVGAGCFPMLPEELNAYSFRALGCGGCRAMVSYLVAVRMGGKHKLIRIYWPSSCQLKLSE